MAPRTRFARIWLLTLLLAMGLAVAFNRLIDPWGLHDGPRFEGVNAVKIRPERPLGELKLSRALRRAPDALILGNSRADIGLDPADPALTALAARPFNMAEPGAALTSQVRYLETLLEAGIRPRLLVVGVELFDALNPPAGDGHWYPRTDAWQRQRTVMMQSLITLAATTDSVRALHAQRDSFAATLRDDGFNPLHDYVALAARDGYRALFRQRAAENVKRIRGRHWPQNLPATGDFVALRRLLDIAGEHGMRVEVMTYPYHMHILGALARERMDREVSDWKQAVADTVAAAAARGVQVRAWDFSLPGADSAEAVPAAGDRRTVTRGYWEGGHFKAALGARMLARALAPVTPPDDDFGRLLTPAAAATDWAGATRRMLAARPDLQRDLDAAFGAPAPD